MPLRGGIGPNLRKPQRSHQIFGIPGSRFGGSPGLRRRRQGGSYRFLRPRRSAPPTLFAQHGARKNSPSTPSCHGPPCALGGFWAKKSPPKELFASEALALYKIDGDQ